MRLTPKPHGPIGREPEKAMVVRSGGQSRLFGDVDLDHARVMNGQRDRSEAKLFQNIAHLVDAGDDISAHPVRARMAVIDRSLVVVPEIF